jgi:putative intracellular protease/amidase
MKQTVVAILYPGCIFFELALALELLAEKYQIVFATPDGSDHQASNGSVIMANTSYEDVDLTNCRAVLVPGGDPGSIKDNKTIDEVIKTANDKSIWLGAICAGPSVLAKAKVLKGKRIAHGYSPKQLEYLKSFFEDVEITEEKFVCDGNVITAKPDAHIDFAVEIACRLDVADASKANRIKDYYRGILGRKIRPLALALIRNPKGQFLFHKGYDKVKDEIFYRPLGGGIEFSESGQVALEREIMEELKQEVQVSGLTASFENIFTFEGFKGHEIIMLFSADFKNKSTYEQKELEIFESGVVIAKAVWRSVAEINAEGSKLYPIGLKEVMDGQ